MKKLKLKTVVQYENIRETIAVTVSNFTVYTVENCTSHKYEKMWNMSGGWGWGKPQNLGLYNLHGSVRAVLYPDQSDQPASKQAC